MKNGKYKENLTQRIYCVFGPIRSFETGAEAEANSGYVLSATDFGGGTPVEIWYGPRGLFYVPRVKRLFETSSLFEDLVFLRRSARVGDLKTEFVDNLVDGFGSEVFFCDIGYFERNFTAI